MLEAQLLSPPQSCRIRRSGAAPGHGCFGSPPSDTDATQGWEPPPSYITDSGNYYQVLKVSRGRQSVGNFPEELLNYHHHHPNPPITPADIRRLLTCVTYQKGWPALMKCLTKKKKKSQGNSLEGQWLGLRDSTAGDTGWIPAWGAKILRAAWCGQKKK